VSPSSGLSSPGQIGTGKARRPNNNNNAPGVWAEAASLALLRHKGRTGGRTGTKIERLVSLFFFLISRLRVIKARVSLSFCENLEKDEIKDQGKSLFAVTRFRSRHS
jgi:hypothetical protein